MALDLYFGGFARYFSREWENVVQTYARQQGTTYTQISPGGPPQAAEWAEVEGAVGNWTQAINAGLGDHLSEPLGWDESQDAPYFTDRPGYDGYGALCLWAAYIEAEKAPPIDFRDDWFDDGVYLDAIANRGSTGICLRVIHSVQIWLPGDFCFSFDFKDLTGESVHIASTSGLLDRLDDMNEKSFRLSSSEVENVLRGEFPEQPTLEDMAKYGFALFSTLGQKAKEHHLPMFFDH